MIDSSNIESIQTYQEEIDRLRSELERAQKTIVDKDKYLDGLAHSFEGVMFLFNIVSGKFVHVGENIENIYGYSIAELNALPGGIFGLIYEEDLPITRKMMEQMAGAKVGQKFNIEYRIKRKDGQVIWTAIWFTPHTFASDGTLEIVTGVKLETSKIKAVETQNVVFDHMIEAMFSQKEIGMSVATSQGNWIRLNQKFADMLGYDVDELINLNCPKITPEKYLEQDGKDFNAIMTGEKDIYDVEKEYIKKNVT